MIWTQHDTIDTALSPFGIRRSSSRNTPVGRPVAAIGLAGDGSTNNTVDGTIPPSPRTTVDIRSSVPNVDATRHPLATQTCPPPDSTATRLARHPTRSRNGGTERSRFRLQGPGGRAATTFENGDGRAKQLYPTAKANPVPLGVKDAPLRRERAAFCGNPPDETRAIPYRDRGPG